MCVVVKLNLWTFVFGAIPVSASNAELQKESQFVVSVDALDQSICFLQDDSLHLLLQSADKETNIKWLFET